MLLDLEKKSRKVEINMNLDITKILSSQHIQIITNGTQIENVHEFVPKTADRVTGKRNRDKKEHD